MKKFILAMVILLIVGGVISGIGCAVYFSGDVRINRKQVEYIERVYEAEAFTSVELKLCEAHKISFERGENYSVRYSESEFSNMSVSAENGALKMTENSKSYKRWWERIFYNFEKTELVITVPDGALLNVGIRIDGSSEMTLPSHELGNVELEVRGAASVIGNEISAKDVKIDASGSASFTLSGRADSIEIHASGSVNFICNNFSCSDIGVSVSGSARLNLSGTGDTLDVKASGSCKINAKDFTLKRASLHASGSVHAELSLSERLRVDASGSARVYYWGNPSVEQSVSGSAHIERRG